jgi:hypothetical protein
MIPKAMIEYIGKIAGIDITQSTPESNQVPLIMHYLNGHSRLPVTYKVRNSTSVDEFFMYYRTRMLLDFSELNLGDGMKKNSISEYYTLTFRVTTEFKLPGLYALIGDHYRKYNGLKFDSVVSTPSIGGLDMIPLYTYTNLYDRDDMNSADGFQFYTSTIVQTDKDKAGQDEIIKLNEIVPTDHMAVLNKLIHDNVTPETIFRFRLIKNSHELLVNCGNEEYVTPCEWEIDWHRKRIVIHNTDPTATYRILTYANLVQINQKYGEMQDHIKRDVGKI